jgi:hypothetical protein
MTEWEYESLEWIHKIRVKNYQRTKNIPLEKVIEQSVKRANKNLQKKKL